MVATSLLLLTGCTDLPPKSFDDACVLAYSQSGWAKTLADAQDEYQVPPGLVMSVIFHESTFNAQARPPRQTVLGFIPWRKSTAYGYAQIKNETWQWYKDKHPGLLKSRTHFSDSVDFIGWYYTLFRERTQNSIVGDYDIGKHFYLAYHDGLGGHSRKSYEGNKWLLAKARKVSERAMMYDKQLANCL